MRCSLAAEVLLCLLAAGAARAQEEDVSTASPQRLYLGTTTLLGSSRVVALGGAYVAIAEGAAGMPQNLAALAHRRHDLDRDWDVGFTASLLELAVTSSEQRDLDNDGERDDARSFQLQAGILLQYKRFGLGWYVRNTTRTYCVIPVGGACAPLDVVDMSYSTNALAGAIALGKHEDLIISFGIFGAQASLARDRRDRRYGDTGYLFDLLYRPHGLPYRLGVSVRPQIVANWYQSASGAPAAFASFQFYRAFVSPALLSMGVSFRLGEGVENYNRLSPVTRREVAADAPASAPGAPVDPASAPAPVPPPAPDPPPGRWLITLQADLISPVGDALPATAAVMTFAQAALDPPSGVGAFGYLIPRAGVEHETWPGRLRTRLGVYVEPSPFPRVAARPHLTGGLEVFVYELWERWALSASFDVSRQYHNLGVSIGFWR